MISSINRCNLIAKFALGPDLGCHFLGADLEFLSAHRRSSGEPWQGPSGVPELSPSQIKREGLNMSNIYYGFSALADGRSQSRDCLIWI